MVVEMPDDDADAFVEQLRQARSKAREATDRFGLSAEERQWVEKLGEELILDWSRSLSERLDDGIGFAAIPAIFAYALAVMEQIHCPPPEGTDRKASPSE